MPTVDELTANVSRASAEYERLEAAGQARAEEIDHLLASIDAQIDTWVRLCAVVRENRHDPALTCAREAARRALPRLAWLRAKVLPLDMAARRKR